MHLFKLEKANKLGLSIVLFDSHGQRDIELEPLVLLYNVGVPVGVRLDGLGEGVGDMRVGLRLIDLPALRLFGPGQDTDTLSHLFLSCLLISSLLIF